MPSGAANRGACALVKRRYLHSPPLLLATILLLTGACAPRNRSASLPPSVGPESRSAESGLAEIPEEARRAGDADVPPIDREAAGTREETGEAALRPGAGEDIPVPDTEAVPGDAIAALVPDLSPDGRREVLARLEYYTEESGRSTIEVGLERAGIYGPMIRRIFREEGVPESLVYLAQAESAFKPEAISRSAARGIWQFISATGSRYGLRANGWIDERSDPEKSTRAAARHLRDLFDEFGDWLLALAGYNAGPARVANAIREAGSRDFWILSERRLLPPETRNYIPNILAMALIGSDPPEYGFEVEPAVALEVERVPLADATDLRVIAERLGLSLAEVQTLNPHVLGWATPPDDPEFELILPAGYGDLFRSKIEPLPERERILSREHRVSQGDTLSFIARLYEVPASTIALANGLENPDAIRIGQSLVIPLSGLPVPGEPDPERGLSPEAPPERPPVETQSDGPVLYYHVRPGDTLTRIAASYSTSVEAILEWNPDSDLSVIRPGDQIRIYGPEGLRP